MIEHLSGIVPQPNLPIHPSPFYRLSDSYLLALGLDNHFKRVLRRRHKLKTLGRFRQGFAENQIAIENDLATQPPITITGDAGRLQQLFSNLVENTLRYADAPGILKIGQECTANRLILSFEDSGPGVPEGALDHLFDRLYRVDRSRSRAQGGSGLGLSICKSIVNALGGEIRASNGNLGGLRIEVEFPHTG